MAQKVTTTLLDDLDNTPIEGDEGGTINFGIDGTSYEIDLNEKNTATLRSALLPYIAKARKAGRTSTARRPAGVSSKEDLAAARTWLRAQGHEVSDRGRISATLLEEYRTANK